MPGFSKQVIFMWKTTTDRQTYKPITLPLVHVWGNNCIVCIQELAHSVLTIILNALLEYFACMK